MGQPLSDHTLDQFNEDGVQTVFAISPFGNSETRAERIARLEKMGRLAPDCEGCERAYAHPTLSYFGPSHTAMSSCRSGRRDHCTCDGCF